MKLAYPSQLPKSLKELAEKYAYAYIAQELLRLRHNEEGAKFREGKISEGQWKDFKDNWYEPRSNAVVEDILELRSEIRGVCSQFNVDLEAIPKLTRK